MRGLTAGAPLLALIAVSGCGGEEESSGTDPFTKVEQRQGVRDARTADTVAPRWERVTSLRGSGDSNPTVGISREAVQWRVRWRCTRGSFALHLTPTPREGNPLGRGRCPGKGRAPSVDTGKLRLGVRTAGRWRATVEQQVTEPVAEPPLRAMKAKRARVLARGRFYGIERRGRGKVDLYRLARGRLALRFEDFATSANTDLFVWVSRARRPRTTKQALRSRHDQFAPLKASGGDQNYLLPKGVRARSVRSVVIWCQPIRIAYTAAMLR
ncbi:MAG: DM13 domain-containing protein [Actinomycetota bacterium]|nr:DM13 domain-containing protein [Actinomycetota bacterium]